jgi:hypothetical protein
LATPDDDPFTRTSVAEAAMAPAAAAMKSCKGGDNFSSIVSGALMQSTLILCNVRYTDRDVSVFPAMM